MGRIINLIYHNIFPNWIKKVIDTYCKKCIIIQFLSKNINRLKKYNEAIEC